MTEESAIELISLVKRFPVLYDRNHPLYNNPTAKSSAWKEIASGCKIKETDEFECQSRWKALRDRYSKQKKKMIENENFKPSSSKVAEFIDQMSFLSNMIVHKTVTKPRKPKSEIISKKRKLHIRDRIIKSAKPIILSHKRKPVITEEKVIVPRPSPEDVVTPVSNATPVAGTSQDDKYVAIQSIQLLPSLPISQWPQLEDENVQYIKIQAEANNRNQSNNWNDNNDDMVDYTIAITDCIGPHDIKDSDGQRSKISTNGCAMMQPLNDMRMEEICGPEVEIKSEKEPVKRDQFGVVNAFWNVVKERAEQDFENSEDHLFAIHLSECLSRFPPRKRNLVKGEILMLMSKFDYEELN